MSQDHAGAPLSPSERAEIYSLLTTSRHDAAARIGALQSEFDSIVESSAGQSTDDEHDPEGATVAFERAQIVALLNQARTHLVDLDGALERLRTGTYGSCERCGRAIPIERLTARPATVTCLRCASTTGRPTRQ